MRPPELTSTSSPTGARVDELEVLHGREHHHRAEHVEAHEHRGNRLGVLDVAENALRDHRRDRDRRGGEHGARRARSHEHDRGREREHDEQVDQRCRAGVRGR